MNNPAVHHATPTLAVIDPRGLAVRGVGYWRSTVGHTAEARVTRQVFDAAGRGVEQWDARLAIPALGHGYNLPGQVLAIDSVDAGWRVLLPGQAGKSLSQWDSRGSRQDFEYDRSLRPTAVREQALGAAVRVLERFEYGAADLDVGNRCGRLIRHDDPAGTRHMPEYDVLGLARSEISHFLTELDTPDWPLDEAARDALLEPGSGLESRWAYNPAGDLLSLVDASGNRRRFNHDVAGQLTQGWLQPAGEASPGRCLVHDIRYNPSNQVERETAGNGVVSEAEYAPDDGRLLRLSAGLPGEPPVQDLRYAVDAAGNIVGIEDRALPVRFFKNQRIEALRTFGYDTLGQLICATGWEAEQAATYPMSRYRTSNDANAVVNYREEYDYDPAGNMTELRHLGAQPFTRRWAVDSNSNRSLLEDDHPADFASNFDRNGNLRFLQRGQAMAWDVRNQLSSVSPVQRENEDDDTERYLYGGGGKRLRKVRTSLTDARTVITEVRYLPGLEIHQRNETPSHQVLNLEAGRNRVQWLRGPDSPAHAMRYHLTDYLGSGTLELDEHASVQSREVYYPFGGTAWEDHSDQSGDWKTLRYSGKERDATGLYYYGYRYFAPWLSRWINPDPAGAVDGLNLYGFVGNSPVSFTDSDGWMKERVGDFLASGRELRDREELVADDRLAMWSLISEGLQAVPAPLAPSAIIENFEFGSQDSQSSTVSEGTALSFARLGDSIGPVSIDEIDLGIPEPANPEPVAGPSSAIQSVSSSGLVPTSGGRRNKKCTMCDKAFTTNSNLAEHIRTHSGTKPFVCSNCGSSFFRKSHLTRHMNAHSGEKPFKCTICGKSFAEMTKLSVHSRIHSIENPLTCSVCNKGFSEKRGLTIHLRVHAGEKPYMCEVCGKSFSQSGHLTQHVKSHSDQKPYGCDLCDRSYKSQSNLARHKKNHV
jgi:insecticidal toxin complex protein TccC